MAHLVCRRGKYWSLEESFRDEHGRPRKRVLEYFGIMPIDWAYTLRGDGAVFNEPPQTPPSVPGQETPAQTSGGPSPASEVQSESQESLASLENGGEDIEAQAGIADKQDGES